VTVGARRHGKDDILAARMSRARAIASVLLLLLWLGCGRSPDSPVAVVRDFLDAMERSRDESQAMVEAYGLLDSTARQALKRRAERARSLSGRPYEPFQMLAQGRFKLNFAPAVPRGMHERVDGDRAVVTVVGVKPDQRAEVPLVRENGQWRIRIDIPPMRNEPGGAPK
jgi:hypothetical protein